MNISQTLRSQLMLVNEMHTIKHAKENTDFKNYLQRNLAGSHGSHKRQAPAITEIYFF